MTIKPRNVSTQLTLPTVASVATTNVAFFGTPVQFRHAITGNLAGTSDFNVPFNIKIVKIQFKKLTATGGAADTAKVGTAQGTAPATFTDATAAMALNAITQDSVVVPTTLIDAATAVSQGGNIRVTLVKTTNCDVEVIIDALRT